MKTINILGCCVCRDIFRINEESAEKYSIHRFIQYINPFSIVEKENEKVILNQEELEVFQDKSNFVKRCVAFDFNKSVQDVIKTNPTDYLIIDLCEFRYLLIKVKLPTSIGYSVTVTKTKHVNDILNNLNKIPSLSGVEVGDSFDLTESEIKDCIDKYISFLTKFYKPEQIILIKNIPTHLHINDVLHRFEECNTSSTFLTLQKLNMCYEYFQGKLHDVNVIDVPEFLVGEFNHKWGFDPLHFVDDYYVYLYKAFEMIVQKEENLKEKLEDLRNYYSNYFKLLIDKKRIEYYLYNNPNSNQFLKNEKFSQLNDNSSLKEWRIQCSNGSTYNSVAKMLKCSNLDNNWAILSQVIDLKKIAGKTLTLSVKYKTIDNSRLNLAFRYKSLEGKFVSFATKQIISYNKEAVAWLTFNVPTDIPKNLETDVAIYVNRPNEQGIVYEAKLELGSFSSII